MSAPVYIHGLRSENVMRLELVELGFDGPGLTIVSGMNGEGKSSLLASIAMALGGKDQIPDRPVREGAKRGEVDIDLGDRVVKLRVRPDRGTTLTVEGKNGSIFKSPQALLDDLVGELAFDPLEFSDAKPAAQATRLRQLVGLDTATEDAEAERVYAERTGVNREAKALEGQLAGMPEAPMPPEPGEEVSASELAAHLSAAHELQAANERTRRAAEQATAAATKAAATVADLEAKLAAARSALEISEAAVRAALDRATALVDPNLSEAQIAFAEADTHNKAVRAARTARDGAAAANRARDAKAADLAAKKAESQRLTDRLAAIDAAKLAKLAAAHFPVNGLSVAGDTVTYRGIPLSQASSSEQLRVCLAIAAALNPRLRLMLVRQGNDLDARRLREVAEWAREQSYQVLLERVAGDRPVGIVIEAGRVAGDYREAAPAAKPMTIVAGDDDF